MRAPNRKITGQNFMSFVQLLTEVHAIALGKPLALISERTGDDISVKISIVINGKISGKTLYKYTEAAVHEDYDKVNPQLAILHCLAEYVIKSKNPGIKKTENYPYWFDYENQLAGDQPLNLNNNAKNAETITLQIESTLNGNEYNEHKETYINKESVSKILNPAPVIRSSNSKAKRLTIIFTLLFVLTLTGYFAFRNASKEDISIDFTTSFKNIYTLDKLLKTGWKVLDLDTNYINQGLKKANGKGLQLYTLPGDYWVTDTMKRFIKNTFVLAIPQGDFKAEVSLSMSDFADFKCSHQQAGIILLSDTVNLANSIRFSVEKGLPNAPHFTVIYSKAKPEKNKWQQNLNDILFQNGFPNNIDSAYDITPKKLTEAALQIIKYHGHFIFRFKMGGNDRLFLTAFVEQFNFEPKYICLTAYQGQVNHRDKVMVCDASPITFSDFHISPNDTDDKILLNELLKKYQ